MSRSPASTVLLPLVLSLLAAAAVEGCNKLTTPPEPEAMTSSSPAAPTAEASLGIVDVTVGQGPAAQAGDKVKVQYTGTLTNGTEFDSSRKAGKPFEFTLGRGEVIKGWDQGVAGMKVGGKRKLTIPASLGYGARGAGGVIPPYATLLFDVELVEIEK